MNWFYAQNGQQNGPIAAEELIAKVASGELPSSTLVWKEGMAEWTPFASVAELQTQPQTPAPSDPVPPAPSAQEVTPASTSSPAAINPTTTTQPQPTPGAAQTLPPGETIPTYLWQSIATTLLCCLPLGIVAIIQAAKVNGLMAAGDLDGARNASKAAKKWATISFVVGLVLGIIYTVVNVLVVMNASEGMPPGGTPYPNP